jgi:anti-anti-sigma factor
MAEHGLLRIKADGDVLWLEGELDMSNADELLTVLDDRDGPLILDTSRLEFLDSTGLKVLLGAASGRNGAGSLVLRRPSAPVRRLLEIAIPDGVEGMEIQE